MQKAFASTVTQAVCVNRGVQDVEAPFNICTNYALTLFRYNKKLALALISKDEKFRWSVCGHGQIHTAGGTSNQLKAIKIRR